MHVVKKSFCHLSDIKKTRIFYEILVVLSSVKFYENYLIVSQDVTRCQKDRHGKVNRHSLAILNCESRKKLFTEIIEVQTRQTVLILKKLWTYRRDKVFTPNRNHRINKLQRNGKSIQVKNSRTISERGPQTATEQSIIHQHERKQDY